MHLGNQLYIPYVGGIGCVGKKKELRARICTLNVLKQYGTAQ